jgi:drug/metabolite transporter (DMT)-like permease
MRSSCSVMSCGVPSVAIVVKSSRATAPLRKRIGAAALVAVGILSNRAAALAGFTAPQWIAGIYLGAGGGALAFILRVMALQRTTPTRVASTMTVNPIAAALLASPLVGEPITPNLIGGLLAVFAGIWLATTEKRKA